MERYTCSWTGSFNILKMLIISKFIYWYNVIPIKAYIFYNGTWQDVPQYIWKCKEARMLRYGTCTMDKYMNVYGTDNWVTNQWKQPNG